MKRLTKKARVALQNRKIENMWVIVTIAVTLVLIALFLGRGWLRMSVAPWTVTTFNRGNPAQKVGYAHNDQLHNPLQLLGFNKLERSTMGCETAQAQLLATEVTCSYDIRAWEAIPQDPGSRADQRADAQKLETLLQQNGWALASDDSGRLTTLPALINRLHMGTQVMAQTASYSKRDSGVMCYLTTYAIETSTDNPGLGASFSCTSWHYFLGKPHRGP